MPKSALQRVRIDWLDKVRIEARLHRFSTIIVLAPARQRDDHESTLSWHGTQGSAHLVPVQFGQADIQQDHVRLETICCVERLLTIECCRRFVPSETEQDG